MVSLVDPILAGRAEVVYGVRVRGLGTVFPSLLYAVGNRVMTGFANLLFGAAISDSFTCLKLFPLPLVRRMRLGEPRFAVARGARSPSHREPEAHRLPGPRPKRGTVAPGRQNQVTLSSLR